LRKKYMRSRYSRRKDMIKYTSQYNFNKNELSTRGTYHSLNRGGNKKNWFGSQS
jgi:hypothetical protein